MIVCAHLHGDRTAKRDRDFMQPSAGLQVGSLIDRDSFNVSLYHEMWHGTLDPSDVPAVDIVFLSGLQKDFDRMRQLAYFFREKGALTIAGGSIPTLFPEFCTRFFDVVCAGGVDSVPDVMTDYQRGNLKRVYRSPQTRLTDYHVDYRLLTENKINGAVHLIEASRGCNFRCDFCVIPAENARHTRYGAGRVQRMIADAIAASPRFSLRRRLPCVMFIDNNFANHLPNLREVCAALKAERRVKAWGALVTQDMLRNREIVSMMADSKCKALFTGLESVDLEFLNIHDKTQNAKHVDSVIEDIAFAQSKGMVFIYGYLFDPRISTTQDMRKQLNTIVDSGVLPFPSFLSYVAPLVGTELFWKSSENGDLRPNLRLRDLDGRCVCYRDCRDSDEELTRFSNELFLRPETLINRKSLYWGFLRTLWRTGSLNPIICYVNYRNWFRVFHLVKKRSRLPKRTYINGTDELDVHYEFYPPDISPQDKERYFDPIKLTNEQGELADWLVRHRKSAGLPPPALPAELARPGVGA